jgi:hypothetical protein
MAFDNPKHKYLVFRLEPDKIKGDKINGYLQTFYHPTSYSKIVSEVGNTYGGGMFNIRICIIDDPLGEGIGSKTFEISGLPKLPYISPFTGKLC